MDIEIIEQLIGTSRNSINGSFLGISCNCSWLPDGTMFYDKNFHPPGQRMVPCTWRRSETTWWPWGSSDATRIWKKKQATADVSNLISMYITFFFFLNWIRNWLGQTLVFFLEHYWEFSISFNLCWVTSESFLVCQNLVILTFNIFTCSTRTWGI